MIYHLVIVSILALFVFNSAYAEDYVTLSSDYYRLGDFLGVHAYANDRVVFDIQGISISEEYDTYGNINATDYQKGYQMFPRGNMAIEMPFPDDMLPGIYKMTFYIDNELVNVQEFGYGVKPPKFTLTGMTNIVPLNDYAFFFGQAQGYTPNDPSFASSVLVEILDQDGNLLEDNWKQNKSDIRGDAVAATKSIFRPALNNGAIYHIIEEDKRLDDNGIPLLADGYRFQIRVDPITYTVGEWYTIQVNYDNMVREYSFLVIEPSVPITFT